MLYTDIQSPSFNGNATPHTTSSVSNTGTVQQKASAEDGCITVVWSEMEYLPWDNPDNIVTQQVEDITRGLKNISLLFFFLIGGPANVINMVVFYKQGLKERVNLCLCALSLADGLSLMANMLLSAELLYLQFASEEKLGPFYTLLVNNGFTAFLGFGYVSRVLSTIIAIERCHCVLSPLKYQTAMKTRTMAVIIIAVYLSVMGIYFIVNFRFRVGCVYDPVSGAVSKTAVIGGWYREHKQLVDFLHSFVFGISKPGLEIGVVTVTTVITVVKLRQTMTWRTGTSSSLSPREAALTRMLVGSSVLFIACVLPVAVARFVIVFIPQMTAGGRHHNFFLTILWVTQVLGFINSSFNIFVYYAMGSRYRETFWAMFGRETERQKNRQGNTQHSLTT